MLTLTTKVGESVVILPDGTPTSEVVVVVLAIKRGRVVLGFQGPPTVAFWREALAKAKFPELGDRLRRLLERVCPHAYHQL